MTGKKHSDLKRIMPYFTVIMIDCVGFGLIIPILTPLLNTPSEIFGNTTSLEAKYFIYGIILAISPLCYVIGAPVVGYLSDHFGVKNTLFICLLGTLIGFACYQISFAISSLACLLIGRVIIGFASTSQAVGQAAIAAMFSGEQKVINISATAVALTIGLVLGPLIGGVLSDHNISPWFNVNVPFYVAISLALFNLLILSLWVEKDVPSLKTEVKISLLLEELLWIFKNKHLMRYLMVFICFELAWSLFYKSLPLIISNISGGAPSLIGIFLAYTGFCLSMSLIFINRIFVQIFSLRGMTISGIIIFFSALLITTFFYQTLLLWILVIPITMGVALCYASLVSEISNQSVKAKQGFIMGIVNSLLALAFAITGIFVGLLFYISQILPIIIAALFISLGYLLFIWQAMPSKKTKASLIIE